MTYSVVAAMASGRRITVARGLCGTAFAVDVSTLPVPGKGMLHVVASDGVRSTELPLAPIDVPERAPTLHILSPAEGARVVFGQALSVLGCCLDMGGSPCAAEHAVWALDGEAFATGSMIAALDGLRSGAHRLTLAHEQPGRRSRRVRRDLHGRRTACGLRTVGSADGRCRGTAGAGRERLLDRRCRTPNEARVSLR